MGSYNETCSISRMTITCNEPVKLIIISPNTHVDYFDWRFKDNSTEKVQIEKSSSCHPNGYWEPLGLAIGGNYNDYGSIDDITNPDTLQYTLGKINSQCVRIGNPQPITTLEEVLIGHNVILKPKSASMAIERMFVKLSVWDYLMSLKFTGYSGDVTSLETIITGLDTLIAALTKFEASPDPADHNTFLSLEDFIKYKMPREYYSLTYLVRLESSSTLHTPIIGEYEMPSVAKFTKYKQELAEYIMFHRVLSELRIGYAPAIGSGGQDENVNLYAKVFSAFTKIAKKHNKDSNEGL